MAINPINFNKTAPGTTASAISPSDTGVKNIQNEITNKQQRLYRLSSDSEMSAEEKAKERQEIQTQIAELNRKLRMLRMEKEEELKDAEKEQEQKTVINENQKKELFQKDNTKDISDEAIKEQSKKVNIPPQNIQKMLVAGSLMQKERIQQSVIHKKEATERILESEINLDELYGTDTSKKSEQHSASVKQEPFELTIKEPQKKQGFSGNNSSVKITIREDSM